MNGPPGQPSASRNDFRRTAAIAGIVLTGVAIVVASVAISVAVITLFVQPSLSNELSDGARLQHIESAGLLVLQLSTIVLTLAVAIGWGPLASTVGWRPPTANAGTYGQIFTTAIILLLVTTFAAFFLFPQQFEQDISVFRPMIVHETWPIAVVALTLGAPLSEELLFRGLLLGALVRQRVSALSAGLVTNTMWTALHAGYSLVGLIEVFLAGVLLTWAFLVTRSVWVPIAIHVFYNTVSLAVIVLFFTQ